MILPTQKPGIARETVTGKNGLIIVVLFLLLGIILALLFYWYYLRQNNISPAVSLRPTYETNKEPESTTAQAQYESLGVLSTSDELSAITADLESTDLTSLDLELAQIDQELESSLVPE